jgi:hypothetical protein
MFLTKRPQLSHCDAGQFHLSFSFSVGDFYAYVELYS